MHMWPSGGCAASTRGELAPPWTPQNPSVISIDRREKRTGSARAALPGDLGADEVCAGQAGARRRAAGADRSPARGARHQAQRGRAGRRGALLARDGNRGVGNGAAKMLALILLLAAPPLESLLLEAIRFPTVQGNDGARLAQQAWLLRTAASLGLTAREAGPVTEI